MSDFITQFKSYEESALYQINVIGHGAIATKWRRGQADLAGGAGELLAQPVCSALNVRVMRSACTFWPTSHFGSVHTAKSPVASVKSPFCIPCLYIRLLTT
jgi:hypothetical protein